MSVTQISDVVVPAEFTKYIVANTMERTDFSQSGVLVNNAAIADQLHAGSQSFTVPMWLDLGSVEADISSDDPNTLVTTRKLPSAKQVVRKSFLNTAWSTMQLAAELSGDNPVQRIMDRAAAYWGRQTQHRLVQSLNGVLANNVANNSSDMVQDIHAALNSGVTASTKFNASSFIDAAGTLGDALNDLSTVAMHSDTYKQALKNDLIQFIPNSQGEPIRTFRGLAVVVDDGLPFTPAAGELSTDAAAKYTTVLFGRGAVGFGIAAPRSALGTEIFRNPAAGNGGGMETLHSRVNIAVAPVGHSWNEGTLAAQSPSWSELATGSHWSRVLERKAVPIAFLVHN